MKATSYARKFKTLPETPSSKSGTRRRVIPEEHMESEEQVVFGEAQCPDGAPHAFVPDKRYETEEGHVCGGSSTCSKCGTDAIRFAATG